MGSDNIFHLNLKAKETDALVLTPEEPYAGLSPFSELNQRFFHGRKREIEKIVKRVEDNQLTILYGKSGIGKSSILRAGVFPELRSKGFLPIDIKWELLNHAQSTKDGVKDDIYNLIFEIINTALKENQIDIEAEPRYAAFIEQNKDAIANFNSSDKLWFFLNTNCFWDTNNNITTLVILFDQFERIFSGRPNDTSFFSFLQMIAECGLPAPLSEKDFNYLFNASKVKYKLLIGLQEDFLPDLAMYEKSIPILLKSKYRLRPFKRIQAKEAIMLPGEEKQLIDASAAESIIKYLGEPATTEGGDDTEIPANDEALIGIEPIFLSVVCKKLNNERIKKQESKITPGLLAELTEKNKLLKDFYEDILNEIVPPGNETDPPGPGIADLKRVIEDNLLTDNGDLNFMEENSLVQKLTLKKFNGRIILNKLIKKRILRREPWLGKQRVYIIHNKLAKAIAEQRNDRILVEKSNEAQQMLLKEKEDAEKELAFEKAKAKTMELQQKLIDEEQNTKKLELENKVFKEKRKKRRLILISSSVIVLISMGLLLSQIQLASANQEAAFLKTKSLEEETNRLTLKAQADSINTALIKAKAASDSITNAADKEAAALRETQKDEIIRLTNKAGEAMKKEIAEKKEKADSLSIALAEVEKQKNSLREKNSQLQIKDDLSSRNISKLNLGAGLIDALSARLFSLKLKDNDAEYVRLLDAVDSALQAKHLIVDNINIAEGFQIASSLWRNNPGTIIDSVLLSFINKTLYYKQSIDLWDNIIYRRYTTQSTTNSPLFSVSADHNKISVNYYNNIFTGSIDPDSLFIDTEAIRWADVTDESKDEYSYSRYYSPAIYDLVYPGEIKILANNHRIISWDVNRGQSTQKRFSLKDRFSQGNISPDGRYLFTSDSGLHCRVSLIPALSEKKVRNHPLVLGIKSNVKMSRFSDDSKKILLLSVNGTLELQYNLDEFKGLKKDSLFMSEVSTGVQAANFVASQDNTVIVVRTNGNVDVFKTDKSPSFLYNLLNIQDYIVNTSDINSISVSRNQKNILINTNTSTILFNKKDNSVFSGPTNREEIVARKFNANDKQNASFVNDSLILSLSNTGELLVWKIYPEFNNLSHFFNTVSVPYNYVENTKKMAEYYYSKYLEKKDDTISLNKAISVYDKLTGYQGNDSYNEYAYRLMAMYQRLVANDTSLQNLDSNFNKMYALTINYNYTCPPRSLSTFFGNQAWYAVNNEKFRSTLAYAKKGIYADSTNDFVYTNLALGYLFTRDFVNAERIYDSLKNELYRRQSKKYVDSFMEDFSELEAKGIIGPNRLDRADIYEEIKKIKSDILKVTSPKID